MKYLFKVYGVRVYYTMDIAALQLLLLIDGKAVTVFQIPT